MRKTSILTSARVNLHPVSNKYNMLDQNSQFFQSNLHKYSQSPETKPLKILLTHTLKICDFESNWIVMGKKVVMPLRFSVCSSSLNLHLHLHQPNQKPPQFCVAFNLTFKPNHTIILVLTWKCFSSASAKRRSRDSWVTAHSKTVVG